MFVFLKYLIQLILSPAHGWEDLEAAHAEAGTLLRRGFLPLLGLTAASEFCQRLWAPEYPLGMIAVRAVVDFGSYFVSVYLARLILESYINRAAGVVVDRERTGVLAVMGVGLMVLIQLVDNLCPWNLILLRFLPLYAVLVIYKGAVYAGVPSNREFNFLGLATVALVVLPLALYYLLFLILP